MTFSGKILFVACRDCALLHPALGYVSDPPDEASGELLAAFGAFVAEHWAHDLVWLRRGESEVISDQPLWDPMAAITFEVTGGGDEFYVVTAQRPDIDSPRVYRFAPGRLELTQAQVQIDDQTLRRGLDRSFYPQALRLAKLERFVSVVHEVIGHLKPDELPIAFDDAEDPSVSIARMPDQTYLELVGRCAEIFDPAELGTVAKFLQANRHEDGLLALRVRREFRVAH